MKFFKRKGYSPLSSKSASGPVLLWSKSFVQASSFKGFRKIHITTYKEPGVDMTLKVLSRSGLDMRGRIIRFDHEHVNGNHGHYNVVNVYVDEMRIGCIYEDTDSYSMLTEYDFDKAYILLTETELNGIVVNLYVHYPQAAPLKIEVV